MTISLPTLPGDSRLNPVQTTMVVTQGPKFVARDHLSTENRDAAEEYSRKLLAEPSLSPLFFVQLIEQFELDNVPGLNAMLENIKSRNAGELGDRLRKVTSQMRHVNDKLPAFDPRFAAKLKEGKAKIEEIVNVVKHLAREIEKALMQYESIRDLIDENATLLTAKKNLMIDAVVRADQLKQEAEARGEKMLLLCAILEFFQEMLAVRLKEIEGQLQNTPNDPALEKERQNLVSVSPLVVSRLGGLKPMYAMNGFNVQRFVDQRNADAITAMKLGDFVEAAIPQWMADVVIELSAMQARLAGLVLKEATDFVNEQAVASTEAYEQQMTDAAALLSDTMIKIETMQKVAQTVVDSSETLREGIEEAVRMNDDASREVERGRNEVANAQKKLAEDLRKVLEDSASS